MFVVFSSYSQEAKSYLLIFTETNQKIDLEKVKTNVFAISLDKEGKINENTDLLSVVYDGFSDQHYQKCQQGNSIPIMENFTTDTFEIDSNFGLQNRLFLEKNIKKKRKIFNLKVKSTISSITDYYYIFVTVDGCVGNLDNRSSSFLNNNTVLMVRKFYECQNSKLSNNDIDKVLSFFVKR